MASWTRDWIAATSTARPPPPPTADGGGGVRGPPPRHDYTDILIDNWSVLLFTVVLQAVATYVLWRRPEESAAAALVVAACGVTGSTLPWLLGLQISDIVLGWPFLLHALTAGGLYMLLWPA